jgi:hypothetical protein
VLSASLVLGVSVVSSTGIATAAPVSKAAGFIATPNGMAGVEQEILIYAPNLQNQPVIIGFQINGVGSSLQTTIGANGYGSIAWTPSISGTWILSGLGNAISLGSTTINVAQLPTQTILMSPNNEQQGAQSSLVAVTTASIGTLAPQGTITVRNANQNVVATGTLVPQPASQISIANIQWTPGSNNAFPLVATFNPTDGASATSVSPGQEPLIVSGQVVVALRFPPVMYVGEPTLLSAVLGQGVGNGSAAFGLNGTGITGSIGTVNGVASTQWTPPAAGIQTFSVSFSSTPQPNQINYSGTNSQVINVQPSRTTDGISVSASGLGQWNPGAPEVLTRGGSTTLSGSATSGSTVIFAETGPCALNGSVLTALGAGQCTITATSPGNAQLKPETATYILTVQNPPRKRR